MTKRHSRNGGDWKSGRAAEVTAGSQRVVDNCHTFSRWGEGSDEWSRDNRRFFGDLGAERVNDRTEEGNEWVGDI